MSVDVIVVLLLILSTINKPIKRSSFFVSRYENLRVLVLVPLKSF